MSATLSANGSSYELCGPAGGENLVLIHGLGLNRQVWEAYLPRLAQRYRVLSYDLYGHGDSTPPPEQPSLGLFSRQLLGLMDELGMRQATLVGFSLGGMINRRLAMDYPERVGALVILNSPHERDPEAQLLAERQALDSAAGGPAATLDAAIARWFTESFRGQHNEYIDRVRGWVLANDAQIYAACRQVLAFGVLELIRPQPPIGKPALVMTCEHDSGSTPAMSQSIAAEIDGAQVVIVPQLQHMGLVENPPFFINAIAEFLEALR